MHVISGRYIWVQPETGGGEFAPAYTVFRVRLIDDAGRFRVVNADGMFSWQIAQAIGRR